MKILNLKQGTPEWEAAREAAHNASEASVMMGCSKHVTRDELIRVRATGSEIEISDFVRERVFPNGHEVERLARPIAEEIIGEKLYPAVAKSDDGFLQASYDGLTMSALIGFECKQWNEAKAADVARGALPQEDMWQVIQQLAVGAEKVLYMVTDGTEDKCVHMWATCGDPEFIRLRAGWKQFDEDVANYVHVEDVPTPVGRAPETLPALRIQVNGEVVDSNLETFKESALAIIGAVNRDLNTDEDFANAKKAVDWCEGVEQKLAAQKENILAQTASIDEVFRVIDEVSDEARNTRLELGRLIKSRNEAIRAEIKATAESALAEHVKKSNVGLGRVVIHAPKADFAGAMKNKRTLASLRGAVNNALAQAKIEVSETADRARINLSVLDEIGAGYESLFPDLQQIIMKSTEDFTANVKLRVAEEKQKQKEREDAERERIRREEAAKLAAEQEARERAEAAECERIRDEEAARIEAENAASIQADTEAARRAHEGSQPPVGLEPAAEKAPRRTLGVGKPSAASVRNVSAEAVTAWVTANGEIWTQLSPGVSKALSIREASVLRDKLNDALIDVERGARQAHHEKA